MTQKEFIKRRKEIEAHFDGEHDDAGFELAKELIYELFKDKDFDHIIEAYRWPFLKQKNRLYIFEVAYSLVETRDLNEAEKIYEHLLKKVPNDTSVLNNLSNIKKSKGNIDIAWDLISKAYDINPNDEIVKRNYENLSSVVQERRQVEEQFRSAIPRLHKENDFVLNKLRAFLANAKKDPDYKKNLLPIPTWKFRVLMQTDDQKANSLLNQWLERGYISRTGERGSYNEHIYLINPYLEQGLKSIKSTKVPGRWISGIENINVEKLTDIGYYEITDQIQKVRKKFRTLLERDINELFLNYIMQNHKATVVLAGSLVESLLIYYCEKKNIRQISYSRNQKTITKKLYEADLGDLLSYFQEQRSLSDILVHMGNISRISRNFIHPGKELRDTEELSQSKADLCFISTLEIIKSVCIRAT